MIFESRDDAIKYIKRHGYIIRDEFVSHIVKPDYPRDIRYGEFFIYDRSMNKKRVVYQKKETK